LGGYASNSEAQPQKDFEGIGVERQSLSALCGGKAAWRRPLNLRPSGRCRSLSGRFTCN